MQAGIANMEKIMGCKFGDASGMPLLVAVRSGARDSMPGMMDTILNLGLNDQAVLALEKATGNARFAWDCYRRFVQMYADVVMGVPLAGFEALLTATRSRCGVQSDADVPAEALRGLVTERSL